MKWAPTLFLILATRLAFGAPDLPPQPQDPTHPGSPFYTYDVEVQTLALEGRTLTVYLPKPKAGPRLATQKFPVVAFGHGHWAFQFTYRQTFLHLAGKGVASIFIPYDTDPWDEDYDRMARDFLRQTRFALQTFPDRLDAQKLLFSGHSNGALIALMAAGMPTPEQILTPQSLVLFAIADAPHEYMARLNPGTVVNIIVGDKDRELAELNPLIYDELKIPHKQFILLKSYDQTEPRLDADHGLCRTYGWMGPRVTPYHYYGTWKYLIGAAQDLSDGAHLSNRFIYGDETSSTGLSDFEFEVRRSW